MEALDLFRLQLRDLPRTAPHDGPALGVGLVHQGKCTLLGAAKDLAQHLDNEVDAMMIVVFEDDMVGRKTPGLDLFRFKRLRAGVEERELRIHVMASVWRKKQKRRE